MSKTSDEVKYLRDDQCRWPIGDPGTVHFMFCDEAKEVGSYCATHAAASTNGFPTYKKPTKRKSVFRLVENGVLEAE